MQEILKQIIQELYDLDIEVTVTRPEPQFGDASTNVALQLAKRLGKSPRDIASEIAAHLIDSAKYEKVEIAGPGFINITLGATELLELTRQEPTAIRDNETVVIETNNPNPFKAMHIGHAFNAVLGDTIANLLAISGARVHRVSYHGDVGLHVGKSMYSLLRFADGDFSKIEQIPEQERNTFMSKMYAEGARAYKEDESARLEINDLAEQSFEPKSGLYVQIYDLCKKWSFEQIDATV